MTTPTQPPQPEPGRPVPRPGQQPTPGGPPTPPKPRTGDEDDDEADAPRRAG